MTESKRKMLKDFIASAARIEHQRLPGWEAFLARDAKARGYIEERQNRMLTAFGHEDEVLFERDMDVWKKSWWRINQVLAEAYRKENPNPEEWQLRYIKWMKIVYIHFTSERGDFYLLPRRPKKKPRVEHWYTAEEMLDMLHPTAQAAIKLSDTMPIRPENLKGPGPGEKHMIIDLHDVENWYYDFPGAVKRG